MKTSFKPILFSTDMVRAILAGRKTQTRREIKKKYSNTDLVLKTDKHGSRLIERQNDVPPPVDNGHGTVTYRMAAYAEVKPKYRVGDILWVRETWNHWPVRPYPFVYKATYLNTFGHTWKPSIHMPKRAARIFLKVISVRVERLQDMSESDAIAEGVLVNEDSLECWDYEIKDWGHFGFDPIDSFQTLWESINGENSWNENPYVWVYEFEVIEKPENF